MKIALVGYGKMGRMAAREIAKHPDLECAGMVDVDRLPSLWEVKSPFDAVVDFSHPDNLRMIGEYVLENPVALVLATTGYSAGQEGLVRELALHAPIVRTANCSPGVVVLGQLLALARPALGPAYDVEVLEQHHRMKEDAPSGTALALVDLLEKAVPPEDPPLPGEDGRPARVYGRYGRGRRGNEIGVHALRGGGIPGEHTVIFAGKNEVLELTHRAYSREVFAEGAIRAARFAAGRPPGLYTMEDVLRANATD
ncbi:MAG: 4-hydroxy-tetrahydrodipicolinate reductase [Bacillota bacterium]|nr:4-hydroxy-tetrahydrodipicolinate reductase [Bacillota bacterium]